MTAAAGDQFPSFTVYTCRNQPHTLDPRSSVIIVYRGHWCGHCRGQLRDLARHADTFHALDVRLTAISADDVAGANDMRMDTGDAVDVFSDPDATAIRQLGLEDHDQKVDHVIARPAVFIVDSAGIVRYRYVSRSASDRPTRALLVLAAESLARSSPHGPLRA